MSLSRTPLLLGLLLVGPLLHAEPAQPSANGPLLANPIGLGNFMHMALGLLIVIGAIFAMTWIIRRMGYVPSRISGAMKIISSLSLGQRERVVLMQVGEQQLVVGIAPGNIRTLLVLEKPLNEAVPQAGLAEGSFAQKLQAMLKGKQA